MEKKEIHKTIYADETEQGGKNRHTEFDLKLKNILFPFPLHLNSGSLDDIRIEYIRRLMHEGLSLEEVTDPYIPYYAIRYCGFKTVKFLFDNGINFYELSYLGELPLSFAVKYFRNDIVRLLIEKCNDINAVDLLGRTALHHACIAGNYYALNRILELEPEVSIEDSYGCTPTAYAIQEHHYRLAPALLSALKTGLALNKMILKKEKEKLKKKD